MADYLAAILTTLTLTVVFTLVMANSDIEAVKQDWNNQRCNLGVMMMGSLYKPKDNPLTASEFSKQNFQFCTQKKFKSIIDLAFAPLLSIVNQQVSSNAGTASVLNSVRTMVGNAGSTFAEMMDKQYRQFSALNMGVLKNWMNILFAVGKMQGIMNSILYMGISVGMMIENMFSFTFNAIIVFLSIMIILLFFLWFVLFPFIPIIISVVAILLAAGIGAAAGMASAFCIDPNAKVKMADGTVKLLKTIELGDQLASTQNSENRVTGILTVSAKDIELVSINGILMSGSHRVLYRGRWILANEHPFASYTRERLGTVICLNTTEHSVQLLSDYEDIVVSDWEEVSTEEGQQGWIDIVNMFLNGMSVLPKKYPTAVPLVSPDTMVYVKEKGFTPIKDIHLYDTIASCEGYTTVKGIYSGSIQTEPSGVCSPEWITDGVWGWDTDTRTWTTNVPTSIAHSPTDAASLHGYFLVTEAEEFMVLYRGQFLRVRDFTEVGASHIDSTYEYLDSFINKK